jgi:short subunit dehydrogenase-like uncharacterized protein
MSKPHVQFAKLNVALETELAQRLGVGQPPHDFWHLYRGTLGKRTLAAEEMSTSLYTAACVVPYALLSAPIVSTKAEASTEFLFLSRPVQVVQRSQSTAENDRKGQC